MTPTPGVDMASIATTAFEGASSSILVVIASVAAIALGLWAAPQAITFGKRIFSKLSKG